MPREVLPLGLGLDRHTGVMAVQPGSLFDMRNLRPHMGKLQARRGTIVQSDLSSVMPGCTSVELIQPVRSSVEGVAVGYYGATREVHVFRTTAEGTDPVHIGKWFDLPANAASPPHFTGAESYGKAFLAHDEARQTLRAVTQVYDSAAGTLADLEANFTGSTEGPQGIQFRGVQNWSDYLIGWGYGTDIELRPEIVRVSLPGEPDRFEADHYFICGDRGSPVLTVKQAGGNLLAMKPTDSYRIVGSSRVDFGIVPHRWLFGCQSTRLAVSIGDAVFVWSFEGPWTQGVNSEADLEDPLSLETPFPADLPSESALRDAFAIYIPYERVVEFHFGERIYALSLADGGMRWSFRTRNGAKAACGSLMFAVGFGESLEDSPGTAPNAAPTMQSITSAGGDATLTWQNNQQDATEVVETWLAQTTRVTGTGKIRTGIGFTRPTYERRLPDVPVTAAMTQSAVIGNVEVGQRFSVAIRYRRAGRYSPGHESIDPNDWPSSSRMEFTSAPTAPALDSVTFLRTSAAGIVMRLNFTPAAGHEALAHNVYRDGMKVGTVAARGTRFDDTGTTPGNSYMYTVRSTIHGVESADSNMVAAHAGPPVPRNVLWERLPDDGNAPSGESPYLVTWSPPAGDYQASSTAKYQVEVTRPDSTVEPPKTRNSPSYYAYDATGSTFRVRLFTTHFGIRDYSEWVAATERT